MPRLPSGNQGHIIQQIKSAFPGARLRNDRVTKQWVFEITPVLFITLSKIYYNIHSLDQKNPINRQYASNIAPSQFIEEIKNASIRPEV
jgi:hypothetical protein